MDAAPFLESWYLHNWLLMNHFMYKVRKSECKKKVLCGKKTHNKSHQCMQATIFFKFMFFSSLRELRIKMSRALYRSFTSQNTKHSLTIIKELPYAPWNVENLPAVENVPLWKLHPGPSNWGASAPLLEPSKLGALFQPVKVACTITVTIVHYQHFDS